MTLYIIYQLCARIQSTLSLAVVFEDYYVVVFRICSVDILAVS